MSTAPAAVAAVAVGDKRLHLASLGHGERLPSRRRKISAENRARRLPKKTRRKPCQIAEWWSFVSDSEGAASQPAASLGTVSTGPVDNLDSDSGPLPFTSLLESEKASQRGKETAILGCLGRRERSLRSAFHKTGRRLKPISRNVLIQDQN